MNYIDKILENGFTNVFINVILFVAALLFIVKLFKELKDMFGIKTVIDTDKEDLEKRLSEAEKKIVQLESADNEILNTIKDFRDTFNTEYGLCRSYIIANGRTQLYNMHREFTKQGYVDKEGLSTFIELGKIYEKSGGNDVYHEKLYPEVTSLPVK